MISLHAISPQNEMPVAERLRRLILAAWPDMEDSPRDRIDILVGVRSPVDVDLLVILDLDKPRELPVQRRRAGGSSTPAVVQRALIAIEVKQLDEGRFTRLGNQWFPIYGVGEKERSVAAQAQDAALGVLTFTLQSGQHPFVHSLAWLTEVDESALREIEPIVLGREASWFMMLDASMQQNAALGNSGTKEMTIACLVVRERLLNRRKDSYRDITRFESLSRSLASEELVDELVRQAGSRQLRLLGRGGSGKTTSLALLAVRLAEAGERVLILTFHRTLRSDIAHLVEGLARRAGVPADRIHVETMMSFVLSALQQLGVEIPQNGSDPDYTKLDAALDETCALICGSPDQPDSDSARIRGTNPVRFAWDHIFIDESQDCMDSERDFLRALYAHRRFILADGIDQMVRRQVACDWNLNVPGEERAVYRLDRSLRMLRNVATFTNCFARALGFDTWRITPQEDLPGGRIIIATGDVLVPGVLTAVVAAAKENKADAVDCLVCLPPKSAENGRREDFLRAAESANIPVWDGTLPEMRASAASGLDALRIVRYESCRGLEGWVTLAVDIDDFAANKSRHPNLVPTDSPVEAELVADRWMLIPLTRAVHTLIISLRDPQSRTAQQLRDAMDDPMMPKGTVEWVDAADLAGVIASQSNKVTSVSAATKAPR